VVLQPNKGCRSHSAGARRVLLRPFSKKIEFQLNKLHPPLLLDNDLYSDSKTTHTAAIWKCFTVIITNTMPLGRATQDFTLTI